MAAEYPVSTGRNYPADEKENLRSASFGLTGSAGARAALLLSGRAK